MKRKRQRKSREIEANSIRKIAPLSFPKWTPKRVVGVVATCVVLLLLYGGDIRRALTGHYNPRISFERGARASGEGAPRRAGEPTAQGAVFDGEVYRTEGRLREASAVAIAASLSGVARSVEQRPVRTVDELLDEIVRRGLLPPGVELVRERNMLVSERSTIHVRFRPEPFGVEIVSLPDAFAPSSAVQAAGWQFAYMNAQLLEGANAEQLAAWTRQPQSQNR
jgi:hypothetical protein